MRKFKLLDSYSVKRNKPKNFDSSHQELFFHEFHKEFEQVNGFSSASSWIDSGGIVANLAFVIQASSLVNLRVAENIRFLLAHHFRLLGKFPLLKWTEYVWISERWSHGYFHWLCDALPRYYILDADLQTHKILLPKHYSKYLYITESLKFLGLEYEFIPRGYKFLTKRISFSEPVCKTGNFYPPVMKKIRESLRSKVDTNVPKKRYYISRKHAKVRRIQNETECESILKSYGFETVYLEKLEFAEQMALLANAETLIGVHGAGLTNMLVCPQHCKIVEIRGETDKTNNCFFSLAGALSLDYYYILAKENPTASDKVGDVYLNPNDLEDFLSKYFHQ